MTLSVNLGPSFKRPDAPKRRTVAELRGHVPMSSQRTSRLVAGSAALVIAIAVAVGALAWRNSPPGYSEQATLPSVTTTGSIGLRH